MNSLRAAAAFVDRAGIALLFPKDDIVLPSLWEAIAGDTEVRWAIRDEHGKFISFTPDFDRVWRWKDELPALKLACAGKHLRGRATLISLRLVAPLYALTGRTGSPDDFRTAELEPLEREVAEVVLSSGPASSTDVHEALGVHERKRITAAIDRLERRLVLTGAGAAEQASGWAAGVVDLVARRYREHVKRLPDPETARRQLAGVVLATAGELSAADLVGALGWRHREAVATLEALAECGQARVSEDAGIRIWEAAGPRAPRV